ncbi:P-loop containing nucleoside triphosphate hydrolase protein [Gloeophyllum trabeum ATCC 11539]|uniref:p-loop containing nucleoside triphosphate hydrolase protein n=1 Tax=Gloeophyllum trabeum (strain ATCC 11539 / FP-39264 / Madison 617) TaxID=670483 RepID=S7RP09_GLOTA|nr:P-loop containing nucleoside triphosphate hydrolase protein [Gloeophyllum trabeum ATCC 11539]EPQ56275.1 P-loop containing nucleoside triphosphate hydrolase protein [Gloeophyllum trabeum ATCC 11539]
MVQMDSAQPNILGFLLANTIGASSANATSSHNATSTSTSPASASAASFFSLLFSPALFEYAKWMLMGSLIPYLQQIGTWLYEKALSSMFVSASFTEGDAAYDWMMTWLAKHPKWRRARQVEVTTRHGCNDGARAVPDDDDPHAEAGVTKFSYIPCVSSTQWMFFRGHWMSVCRSKDNTGWYGKMEETLRVRILSWDQRVLTALLHDARAHYDADKHSTIHIYAADGDNEWRSVGKRPKRPLRSIVLAPGVKEDVLADAREFLASKEWYNDRGIPFRRGYLLYGAPGSGKTSLIQSLAGELGLNVYIITLSRAGMDDATLCQLISNLPDQSIAIMEDIDAAFTQGINRESADPAKPASAAAPPRSPQGEAGGSRVTLSGLLNAIDGVGAQEGRILFATTNKYHSLDPALCRPGRMDKHIEFRLASRYQARELFLAFYEPPRKREREEREKEKEREGQEKWERDSGFEEKLVDVSPPSELDELAEQFATAIPERECSMATLQGYLMQYKTSPRDAALNAAAWAMEQREEQKRRAAGA